jgi:ribosomal protein S18 acetylase RimI-like enzyme
MSFVIRRAGLDDAHAIATVQVESWKTTYRGIVPDEFLNDMTVDGRASAWATQWGGEDALIFVAEDAEGVFGFVCGGPLREACKEYDAELYAIYLLQARQRAGVGREMTRRLMEELGRRRFRSMLVWVLEENPARAFYERLGGVVEARKTITLGGKELQELAYGWMTLARL